MLFLVTIDLQNDRVRYHLNVLRKKLTNAIIWEMHGFSHQFFRLRENATKLMVWGKSRKLILILFPQCGCFFPVGFPSYGILHHLGNAWVSPSISHDAGKCSKTHCMGRTWEIGTHIFPVVWVLFSIRFPCYGILHRMENAWVFSSNFPQHQKNEQNPSNGKSLGNQFPYFFHKMGVFFFPLDSHPVVYFIIWEMQGFSQQVSIAWEKRGKPIK